MARATWILSGCMVVAVLFQSGPSVARQTASRAEPVVEERAPASVILRGDSRVPFTRAAATTTVLYTATFDGPGGMCDPQGWTVDDPTAQPGVFFHIDNYAGLNPADFYPLDGAQSLWCGARPQATGELCTYAALPGYGNFWYQAWVTRKCIPVSSDSLLDIAMELRIDSEPAYDISRVQFTPDCAGESGWQMVPGIPRLDGSNYLVSINDAFNIHTTDSVRVRIEFASDGAFSDEDGLWNTNGALHVDNLAVENLPLEDFEGEPLDATMTHDWEAWVPPAYGVAAGLRHGDTILQEDPCVQDISCLWAFLEGSTFNYACGGHAEQVAVPYHNDRGQYLDNTIVSPEIALTGSGDRIVLEFDVYRDLAAENLVIYMWRVRASTNGCGGPWKDRNMSLYGDQKDWFRHVEPIDDLIGPGATAINIGLRVVDLCRYYCAGMSICHSQSPLFDNVRVYRVDISGPELDAPDRYQFQDNFSVDGTTTGTVRADMASDILPSASPGILPGDSAVVMARNPVSGLATDPVAGGPAVYCYVAVWPQGQPGKSGAGLTDNPARWPAVGSFTDASGVQWTRVRADTVFDNGQPVDDTFCVDLNDNLFTPGDTVCFFYAAKSNDATEVYAFGSNLARGGNDIEEAASNPSEFTCLPTSGTKVDLYVDGADGTGAQLYWEDALRSIQYGVAVDRYDVRAPSAALSNRPAGRVVDPLAQLSSYQRMLWDCAGQSITLGDGTGTPEKTDDYALLTAFLDNLQNPGGVFLCGDDVAEQLDGYAGAAASAFHAPGSYLPFTLISGNLPSLTGQVATIGTPVGGLCYDDSFWIYGACPLLNDFDVMQAGGGSVSEVTYGPSDGQNDAVISKMTVNPNNADVGVILAGFGFQTVLDDDDDLITDRSLFLRDTIVWLANTPNLPTGAATGAVNALQPNYPNPFNPQTTIAYSTRARARVTLVIYNVSGERVRTLVSDEMPAGAHTTVWDGRNDAGREVSSGVYFYRLVAGDFTRTRKMVLLK